jgi:hypothetical protein
MGGMETARNEKKQRDETLVKLALTFLPKMNDNPKMLAQFTSHPDFAEIRGAFERTGMSSVFARDPQTGGYKINIPSEDVTLDQLLTRTVRDRIQNGQLTDEQAQDTLMEAYQSKSMYSGAGGAFRNVMNDYNDNETAMPDPQQALKDQAAFGALGTPANDRAYAAPKKVDAKGRKTKQRGRALVEVLAQHGKDPEQHFQKRGERIAAGAHASTQARKRKALEDVLSGMR